MRFRNGRYGFAAVLVVIVLWAPLLSKGQTAPAFEVASVKTMSEAELHTFVLSGADSLKLDGAMIQCTGYSLAGLIAMAYKVNSRQVSGPEWVNVDRFTITAKIPAGVNTSQVPEMLQSLLTERFQLAVQIESVEQAAYALVTNAAGPNWKVATPDDGTPEKPYLGERGDRLIVRTHDPPHGYIISRPASVRIFTLESTRFRMSDLANVLSLYSDLPVVDKTGLTAEYEVSMQVPNVGGPNSKNRPAVPLGVVTEGASTPQLAADPEISIFKCLQKVGLSLEKKKLPIQHLVIKHAERPTIEN
jgi:uncharacterized protein (TIGR03435 family)